MEKFQDEKNIHQGHRTRLLNLITNSGIENVSNIQAMEFVLTYIFPRGDVNPLAHRLLKKYQTLANVLDADVNDLQSVPGIGERAALLLTALPEIFHLYMCCRISKKESLLKNGPMFDFCEILARIQNSERLYIVALDNAYRLINYRCLAKGTINMVGISRDEITKFLNSTKPVFVFMLHNHPGGSAKASNADITATKNLQEMFIALGKNFIDHYIVGIDGIYSVLERRMMREYIEL